MRLTHRSVAGSTSKCQARPIAAAATNLNHTTNHSIASSSDQTPTQWRSPTSKTRLFLDLHHPSTRSGVLSSAIPSYPNHRYFFCIDRTVQLIPICTVWKL